MSSLSATAFAHPNIAFIKYRGNTDDTLRIPVNGSISMNLAGLQTTTTVEFQSELKKDLLTLNKLEMTGTPLDRVTRFLDHVRNLSGIHLYAHVIRDVSYSIWVETQAS